VELDERISADGRVERPLRPEQAEQVLATLYAMGIESLAVSLLNSPVNPAHERQIAGLARARWPNVPVTVSHEVLPEIREYERARRSFTPR
jgi:N-methylhydantoinase A